MDILANAILLLGFVLKIAGFMVRDEILLRVMVASGLLCDALFYGLRSDPVWQSVAANTVLVTINVVLILIIVTERTTWRMSDRDKALFAHFPTLTPGQYRRLKPIMSHHQEAAGSALLLEGQPVAHLTLVLAERIEILKQGRAFPIAGPSFVGEIAFLTGERSSAGVHLPEGGQTVRLPIDKLTRLLDRSPPLRNAMVALFGQELARKTAYSVPVQDALVSASADTPR